MLVLLIWKSLETNPQRSNHHRHIVPRPQPVAHFQLILVRISSVINLQMSNHHCQTLFIAPSVTQLQLKIVWKGLEENMHTYNEGINGMPIRDMVNFPFFDQVIKSQMEKVLAGLTAKQFIFSGV